MNSVQIADELRRRIVGGDYDDGDALEPSSRLMARFGVSRPTLRAAFRILEGENLVTVRQGSRSGARVSRPTAQTATRAAGHALQANGATLRDLYEAQLAFEPFAAGVLARRCDPRDIVRLRTHLTETRRFMESGDVSEQVASQARFHQLLADLTGNKVLVLVAGLIANVLEAHHSGRARAMAETPRDSSPEFRSRGTRSMSKLVRFVEAGDGPGAEAHWREHLTNSTAYWMTVFDPHEFIELFGDASR